MHTCYNVQVFEYCIERYIQLLCNIQVRLLPRILHTSSGRVADRLAVVPLVLADRRVRRAQAERVVIQRQRSLVGLAPERIKRRVVEAVRRRADRPKRSRRAGRHSNVLVGQCVTVAVDGSHLVVAVADPSLGRLLRHDAVIVVVVSVIEIHAQHTVAGQRINSLTHFRQTLLRIAGVPQRRTQVIHHLTEHGRVGRRHAQTDRQIDGHIAGAVRSGRHCAAAAAVVNWRIAALRIDRIVRQPVVVSVRRSGRVEIGNGSRHFGIADIQTRTTLGIFANLGQDHGTRFAVAIEIADDRDAALLQRLVFGLLRYLNVRSALLFDLLDVSAAFANYHTCTRGIDQHTFDLRDATKQVNFPMNQSNLYDANADLITAPVCSTLFSFPSDQIKTIRINRFFSSNKIWVLLSPFCWHFHSTAQETHDTSAQKIIVFNS